MFPLTKVEFFYFISTFYLDAQPASPGKMKLLKLKILSTSGLMRMSSSS